MYIGSESSPPCTEGIYRIIMKTPITLRPSQLDAVESYLYNRDVEYDGNYRRVQLYNGRNVYSHNDTSTYCEGLGNAPFDAKKFIRDNKLS